MKPLILFDLDCSLADYAKSMCNQLNKIKHGLEQKFTIDNFHSLSENHEYIKARKDLISTNPGFWIELEQIEKGMKIWRLAGNLGFDRVVLTQVPKSKPIAAKEKHEWVIKHLGKDVDFCLTRRKGITHGSILYDDYGPYMDDWLESNPKGYGIMPQYPFNKDYAHPRCMRHTDDNFETIAGFLEDMVKVYA